MPNQPTQEPPQTMLGFDFGTKRIGMAVGQTLTQQANPLKTVTVTNNVPGWQAIVAAIGQWEPSALVVGLPLNMDGSEQDISQRARYFAKTLREKTGLPVHLADERLTTVTAKQRSFDQGGAKALAKADLDSLAAATMLTSFLQSYAPGEPSP
jgi:putative holliday junction resolvase